MRSLADKGLEDLREVKNRLLKDYAMGRLDSSSFSKILPKLDELIKLIEDLPQNNEE